MAVNVKMGVDIGGFTAGIKQGQQILKGLNAEMKASEAEFKATGNAEQKLQSQTKTLNSQLNVQRGIADQAKNALKAMTDAGINPADAAYQKLYVQMLNAEAGANEAQAALNALGGGAEQAATGADKLTGSLQGISQKMSLQQVQSGIEKITGGLEKAAQKAIELGERLWDTIMDSARRADDTQTMAEMYGIDLQRYKQMQALVAGEMDTSVEAMLGAQDKLKKGIGSGSQEIMDDLEMLGVAIRSGKSDTAQLITEDTEELFWRTGKALLAMDDAFDKEATAQKLFGKSWKELKPLFDEYDSLEDYNKALSETSVSSEEATKNSAELADRVGELENTWTQLKDEIIGAVAPALTEAVQTVEGLLARILEYLQTPEGKKALEDMGKAVQGLFSNLSEIDPEKVVEGFTGVFNKVIESLQWLDENKQTVIDALKFIIGGWAALRLTGGALQLLNLVNGLKGLGPSATPTTNAPTVVPTSNMSFWQKAGVLGLTGEMMMLPAELAVLASKLIPEENKLFSEERVGASQYSEEELNRLRQWVDLQNQITDLESKYGTADFDETKYNQLTEMVEALGEVQKGDLWSRYWDYLVANGITPGVDQLPTKILDEMLENPPEIPVDFDIPDNAAAGISEQVGTVVINGIVELEDGDTGVIKQRKRPKALPHRKANGIWSVPYDGYLATLHKGERVMTAREVSARNYSSNLYVESMYMNGGTDAAGLAAAMAAAQRRTMSGYGS